MIARTGVIDIALGATSTFVRYSVVKMRRSPVGVQQAHDPLDVGAAERLLWYLSASAEGLQKRRATLQSRLGNVNPTACERRGDAGVCRPGAAPTDRR